ncbi:MAG: hypothetical protein AAF658_22315, partial [Myxococcota bacterium]
MRYLLPILLITACGDSPDQARLPTLLAGGRLSPLGHVASDAREGHPKTALQRARALDALVDTSERVLVEFRGNNLDPDLWRRWGGRTRHRFEGVAEAWIPVVSLPELVEDAERRGTRVRFPPRPLQDFGDTVTQGVELAGVEPVHCAGSDGSGVTVSVVDTAFAGFEDAVDAGEIPNVTTTESGFNQHGTACSEIVVDMAPGVTIDPVRVQTGT